MPSKTARFITGSLLHILIISAQSVSATSCYEHAAATFSFMLPLHALIRYNPMSSSTPLLPLLPRSRKDFLDNLRCTLTILLVSHHAIIETALSSGDSVPIAVVVTLVNTFLWSTFFFVSGYATSLSQGTRVSLLKKGVKVNLPALFHAVVGQWALFALLSKNWPYIFGNNDKTKAYARFSGPVPYIALLFLFDSATLLIFRRFTIPSWTYPNLAPKFVILIGFIALASYTFLSAALFVPNAHLPRFVAYLVYDSPDPSFPISHILAYAAGWQFKKLKRSVLSSSATGATLGLFISTATSAGSLYLAQSQWPSIASLIRLRISDGPRTIFIDGGLNAHTAFFSFWSSFTRIAISISVVSLFFHMDSTSATWGWFGRKTYLQTYLHMIPVLTAEYHLRKVQNQVVKYGLVELIALSGTWLSAYAVYGFLRLITVNVLKIKRFIKW